MSFTITFQRNNSEVNALDKRLDDLLEAEGVLKEQSSIIDPQILVAGDLADFAECNYMSVPAFGRSYFVRDITSVRSGLLQISAHVDVLSSFKAQIRQNSGIVTRGENTYNLYLNDGSLKAYQDPYILTAPFPSGFTGQAFILAVAGG